MRETLTILILTIGGLYFAFTANSAEINSLLIILFNIVLLIGVIATFLAPFVIIGFWAFMGYGIGMNLAEIKESVKERKGVAISREEWERMTRRKY